MTDEADRAAIEAAYRRLPILPEREKNVEGFVDSLANTAGPVKGRNRKVSPASQEKVFGELEEIAKLARKLSNALTNAHHSTITVLGTGSSDIPMIKYIAEFLGKLEASALIGKEKYTDPNNKLTLPSRSHTVAFMLASDFYNLTGKSPAVSTKTDSYQRYGKYYDLVHDVFKAMGIDGNTEEAALKASRAFKNMTTAAKGKKSR